MQKLEDAQPVLVGIKSIRKSGREDVYCMLAEKNGTMIANGIVVSNCDAFRYAIRSYIGNRTSIKAPKQDEKFGKTLGSQNNNSPFMPKRSHF